MKFSIITATKNNKHGLKNAIECVRNQSYKNVEHIIIDGGSTDGSVELLRECEAGSKKSDDALLHTNCYLLRTITEPDNGIYDAINKGIKMASGDVIGLLHSDDLYADEIVLERVAEAFRVCSKEYEVGSKWNGVEAVYSDLVYVRKKSEGRGQRSEVRSQKSEVRSQKLKDVSDKSGYDSHQKQSDSTGIKEQASSCSLLSANYSILRYWKAHTAGKNTDYRLPITDNLLRNGWMPPHPTLFLRKEVFEKYGLYRTDMKIASDYEMILRLFYKHKISSCYLPYTTYLMTIGGASNKSAGNILTKSKEDYKGLKLHGMSFPLFTLFLKNIRKIPQFF